MAAVQTDSPDGPSRKVLALRWLAAIVLAASIYDGWIFYSRWSDRQDAEKARSAAQAKEQSRQVIETLGGNALKILDFYATSASIRRGQPATLCYGVSNAKTVRMEPPVEPLWPALSRCIQVSPEADTEYKIIAADAAGHEVSQTIVVKVTGAKPAAAKQDP